MVRTLQSESSKVCDYHMKYIVYKKCYLNINLGQQPFKSFIVFVSLATKKTQFIFYI